MSGECSGAPQRGLAPQNVNHPAPRLNVCPCFEKRHAASLSSPHPKPGEVGKQACTPCQYCAEGLLSTCLIFTKIP